MRRGVVAFGETMAIRGGRAEKARWSEVEMIIEVVAISSSLIFRMRRKRDDAGRLDKRCIKECGGCESPKRNQTAQSRLVGWLNRHEIAVHPPFKRRV